MVWALQVTRTTCGITTGREREHSRGPADQGQTRKVLVHFDRNGFALHRRAARRARSSCRAVRSMKLVDRNRPGDRAAPRCGNEEDGAGQECEGHLPSLEGGKISSPPRSLRRQDSSTFRRTILHGFSGARGHVHRRHPSLGVTRRRKVDRAAIAANSSPGTPPPARRSGESRSRIRVGCALATAGGVVF